MTEPTPLQVDYANHHAARQVFGDAGFDPLWLRVVERDAEPVVYGKCPGCGEWAELDGDMLHGRVSTHHDDPACGYHEVKDWWDDHVASKVRLPWWADHIRLGGPR